MLTIEDNNLRVTLLGYSDQGSYYLDSDSIPLATLKAALEAVGSTEPESKGSSSL